MDHPFFEAATPRLDPEDRRAAMLEVDLIALRLRVAMAKADLQLRSARCASLEHSSRERLVSREAREERRHHLDELRNAVSQYAHLLGATGATRQQVICLVRETVEEVTARGPFGSSIVSSVVGNVLQLIGDAPAA